MRRDSDVLTPFGRMTDESARQRLSDLTRSMNFVVPRVPVWYDVGVVTAYNGLTTGSQTLDLSADFGVPAEIALVYLRLVARDSGSSGAADYHCTLENAANEADMSVFLGGVSNDRWRAAQGWVVCDDNGDIIMRYSASGAGTMDAAIRIKAYAMSR